MHRNTQKISRKHFSLEGAYRRMKNNRGHRLRFYGKKLVPSTKNWIFGYSPMKLGNKYWFITNFIYITEALEVNVHRKANFLLDF
jgi:hypothetical protein